MMVKSWLKALWAVLLIPAASLGFAQQKVDLDTFLHKNIGLNDDEIRAVRNGQAVVKALPPRTPSEVLLFGAVYVHASPEAYLQFARNFDRLRSTPGYLALGVFTDPPQLTDLAGFTLDNDEVQALKSCEPGNCEIQMPATSIEELHRSINWSAGDVNQQVNQLLQKTALDRLVAYQRQGNAALGVYDDKRDPTAVPEQFAYLLSYSNALAEHEPDFYQYLVVYPRAKPARYEDTFYWAKVKFGLKPTLRIVHMVTMRGQPSDPIACAIARKQLYSSHYFQTALDLSICVRANDGNPQGDGFYLLQVLGSEQAGLTGVKGSMLRSVAVGRATSNLQSALASIKSTLEAMR